jgi:hypothetical protein
MKQISLLTIFWFSFTTLSNAQTVLYSEDFNGASPTFQLNTNDLGGVDQSSNVWVINSSFNGGDFDAECLGFQLPVSIGNTPTQPAGIVLSPESKYLHITSTQGLPQGVNNCYFIAADGFCNFDESYFAKMSTNINTTGQSNVVLSFWWLCQGGQSTYGEVYYSTDGGNSWILETGGSNQYLNEPNWVFQTITNPNYSNQPNLRFAFRFVNESGQGAQDPAFGIDDVNVTADVASNTTITTGSVSLGPYCPGEPIIIPFSVTGNFDAGNIFTAQLSDATGSFGSQLSIGQIVGTTNGVIAANIPPGTPFGAGYTVRVVANSPNTIGSTSPVTFEISGAPTSSISNLSSSTVCTGGTATLSFTGSNGTLQWSSSTNSSGPFSPIAGATFQTYTSGPLTQTTYFRVTTTTDCGSAISTTWTVLLTNSVTIPLSSTPSSLNLCSGPITVATVGTYLNLLWSTGQSGLSAIIVTTPGVITVTGTDPSGCPAASLPITIIETTPPTLNVTPASPLTICGANAQLTASGGFVTYAWTGPTASATGNPATVTGPGSIFLTATAADGCVATFGPIQAITGVGVPVPISPSIAAICDGEPATLTAGTGFTNYVWNNGATGQIITVTQSGYYNVTSALDVNGCPGQSALVEVFESQFPVPNFTYIQTPGGYTIQFDNTSQNGLSFGWRFDSLGTSPIENPTFTFPDNGPYYITLYVYNPCDTDSVTKLIIVAQVGFEDLQNELGISVYPNPSSGDFNLFVQNSNNEAIELNLFDMTGRLILNEKVKSVSDTNTIISTNDIEVGSYILHIKQGNKSSSIKLLKTN